MPDTAKKVVILLGSPRRKGNSATLSEKIAEGALSAGAIVKTFFLHEMHIRACDACEACHKPGGAGRCVIDDEMQKIYPEITSADALVIASPVYWFAMSAQIKTCLDRCYALIQPGSMGFADKRIAVVLTYGHPDPLQSGVVNASSAFRDAFRFARAEMVGILHCSTAAQHEVADDAPLLEKALKLGRRLVRD